MGLKEIHKANIIHRDLKPDNIFINEKNQIKIGDFGISKILEVSKIYANSNIGGTLYYMAPELVKGQKYNNKVDLYSLGCIIYELFTLNEYFIDTKYDNKNGKIDLNLYNPKWQNLIDLLLKNDYHQRPDINEVYQYIVTDKSLLNLKKYQHNIKSEDNKRKIISSNSSNLVIEEEQIDNEHYSGMYEKNFYIGQKILFVMFFSNDLKSQKDKNNTKDEQRINPKYVTTKFGNDECISSILGYYGYEVILVTNYEEAINELCKKNQDNKCIYNSLWVISGKEIPDIPSNNGDSNAPYYVEQFVDCAIKFWKNGGSLVLLGEKDPYNFQVNLFLKKIVFPDGKKPDFKIGGNHKGGKILYSDDSGKLTKNKTFNGKIIETSNFERKSLAINLVRLFEGENMAFTIGDITPFIPFSKDSEGGINSLFYCGLDIGDGKGEGDIVIDCGYNKFFLYNDKCGVTRYLQNIGGFIGSAERRANSGFDPKFFRPDGVDYNFNKSPKFYYKYP